MGNYLDVLLVASHLLLVHLSKFLRDHGAREYLSLIELVVRLLENH